MIKDYTQLTPKDVRDILEDYAYDDDIMNNEDERTLAIKEAMTHLPVADRIIFCLYLELGSSRTLGKFLGGISHSTILKEIKRIRQTILDDINQS